MSGERDHFTPWVELYRESESASHVGRLSTSAGERGVYDCASSCNRCMLCFDKCPTAVLTGDEAKSPRGRTQLIRMAMEQRLKLSSDGASMAESLETCLNCWACVSACPSRVPVPELALEGLRSLGKRPQSPVMGFLLSRLSADRKSIEYPVKLFNLFRLSGLYGLLGSAGVFRLAGEEWLGRFNQAGLPARLKFLDSKIKESPAALKSASMPPACYYFSSCSVNYFYPETGLSTLELLHAFVGPVHPLWNGCCGYAAYRHGRLQDARRAMKQVLYSYQRQDIPVVTDCPSCAAFLKDSPQLFAEDADLRDRARAFAANVRYIGDMITPDKFKAKLRLKKPVVAAAQKHCWGKAAPETMRVTFNDSCIACHRLDSADAPRKMLHAVFGKRFAEMPESGMCCGGADGYALFQPELSRDLGRRKAANAASVQADLVATSSVLCVAQIGRSLKRYYPQAVVAHYSDLLRDLLDLKYHDNEKAGR